MRAPTNPVLVNCVGTGVLDRPLTKRNLRTVREAGPYGHRDRLCEIKELHKPKFINLFCIAFSQLHKFKASVITKVKQIVGDIAVNASCLICIFCKIET